MRRQWLIFVAAVTALGITACGSGDGIVINGTTAAEAESDQVEESGSQADSETTYGTTIEIVTGETTAQPPTVESAAESTEGFTEAAPTEAPTAAPTMVASTTKAAAETTAAKTYKVTDVKKTMYATASVRVRSSYSTGSDVLAALADGEKVEVTGQSENGWMRVSYKGHVGYVSGSYLSDTPPATKSASSGQSNSQSKPTITTGSGTTPGGTTGPTAGNNSGSSTGPTASGSGGTTSPGGTTGPAAGSGSGTTNPGGGSSGTGSNSMSGTVTALDPSGVTVQASNGTSYQFVWGSTAPNLVAGDQVHISYETTSSGEKRITGVSR
ncbi:MAG: SH3 domain-containing protein [Hungatella sp.]|nr:SH3 domain-containing protein [Hungatella sp.]